MTTAGRSRPSFADHPAKERWLLRLARLLPAGANVLDLGCGQGHACVYFGDGHEYVGVDSKPERVLAARELYPAATFVRANYTRLDLPDAVADAVVALETFHQIRAEQVEPMVGRLSRWLRGGGLFLMYVGRRDVGLFVDERAAALTLHERFVRKTGLHAVELDASRRSRTGDPRSLWLLARKTAGVGERPERGTEPLADVVAEAARLARERRRSR